MYIPESFRVSDDKILYSFIANHPFATVVSSVDRDYPVVTHVPLVLRVVEGSRPQLIGHFARSNNHCEAIQQGAPTTAIFHGPHAYISASWYEKPTVSVPTWNYAVVHASGKPEAITEMDQILLHLQESSDIYESVNPSTERWSLSRLDRDLTEKLIAGLCVFSIHVEKLEGKFKLGQNRQSKDVHRMIESLEGIDEQELAQFMKRQVVSS